MRRDFSKKQYLIRQRASSSRRRAPILLVAIAILLAGAGFVGYQYKKHPENFPVASANFSRFANWLSHDKQVVQASIKSKQVAVNEATSEKQIHFEFYTALPNMRMKASKPVEASPVVEAKAEKPQTIVDDAAPAGIISSQELERDFSTQLAKQPYVVQLGVFGNQEAANGYKQSLLRAGFNVDVVKVALAGKMAYRVQFGPFSSKDQARVVQKQLQKKNVSALIRKSVALQ